MTKIGIIRCQDKSDSCAGDHCFPSIRDKSGYFEEYEYIDLVGFDTCGGCPGKNNTDKLVERANRLKRHGAEFIHLSTCLVGLCPNAELFETVINEKVELPVKKRTHARPSQGHTS